MPGLWAVFTLVASAGQVLRNALQKELTATLGTVGATHVRFLFGLPFALLFLPIVLLAADAPRARARHGDARLDDGRRPRPDRGHRLLLAVMQARSFVVTTAYVKTEPLQVALFGLLFLGDRITPGLAMAMLTATAGVLMLSWPRSGAGALLSVRPALLGIGSGALFAIAAIGYRGGIRALATPHFVVAATVTLVLGLLIQVFVLTAYLLIADRAALQAIVRAWRPSLFAGFMGAFASQMWYLAFALESAAKVRTLALIEILFAQLLSRITFRQRLAEREAAAIGLIVAGVALLLNW